MSKKNNAAKKSLEASKKQKQYLNAIHEAGHCYFNHTFKRKIHFASVKLDEAAQVLGLNLEEYYDDLCALVSQVDAGGATGVCIATHIELTDKDLKMKYVATAMGGGLATKTVFGSENDTDSDFQKAAQEMKHNDSVIMFGQLLPCVKKNISYIVRLALRMVKETYLEGDAIAEEFANLPQFDTYEDYLASF